jgi:L-cysteine S-thiosulfotransferase
MSRQQYKTVLAGICAILVFSALATMSAELLPAERRSGFADMSRETQAMQADDSANPGMLWVLEGEALWNAKPTTESRACADCHGEARLSMKGVAARYPLFDEADARPIDIEQQIQQCRSERQQAAPLQWESPELLALTAYVARQSRGMPIEASRDIRMQPAFERGRELFTRREGQLNLSCSACHDDNWGKRLAGNVVPQGHPNGYPLYRLEWQSLGSLQRRLRNCMVGVRAEPYAYGSPEYVALEAYLMRRASGMPMEAPAVRP